MKEIGGKTGGLVGLDLPLVGGGTEVGSDLHTGATVWVRGEPFKAESETADLWQPKCSENQTVLATAIHTPDRDAGPPEGAAAWSWSLGIVEQSLGKGCCWLWREGSGDVREETVVRNACGGKLGSHGSKAILLSHAKRVEPSPQPLSPHMPALVSEQ